MQSIRTDKAPAPIGPYSQAVRVDSTLYCSGQVALDPVSGEMQQASIAEETEQVLQNLQAVLKAGGSGLDQVVKCSIFLTDMGYFQEVNEVYSRYFTGNFPARETVAVKALPAGARVEISCVAVCF